MLVHLVCFLWVILGVNVHSASVSEETSSQNDRSSKVFPFLAVVNFPNSKCTDTTSGNSGLCYTSTQCTRMGGTVSGTLCAQGYGVCCLFVQSCSGNPPTLTVNNNITKLVGDGSRAQTQPCEIRIPKKAGVCQLRLDFIKFEVGSADPAGVCQIGSTVTFTAANLRDGLTLCGLNTKQHLYLHYGQMDTITINTNLNGTGSVYDIDVTMIKCDSPEKAPDGCTQYFTAPSGQVTSFNYNGALGQQLNSERYSVCVSGRVDQAVTWEVCGNQTQNNMTSPFFITGNINTPSTLVPRSGDACMLDFILIPPNSRMCGFGFSGQVRSIAPFTMYVNFDDSEVPILGGPANPDTGCPVGTLPSPADPMTCVIQDPWIIDLIDFANTGFCLWYSVV